LHTSSVVIERMPSLREAGEFDAALSL
jgi:hypothetical protein